MRHVERILAVLLLLAAALSGIIGVMRSVTDIGAAAFYVGLSVILMLVVRR